MTSAATLAQYDVAQAFGMIDARLGSAAARDRGLLRSFRRRLVGELVFNAAEVAATLAPEFELVTRAGGAVTVTSRAAMLSGIAGQGAAEDAIMWVEFDDLVVDGAIASHGVLRTALTGAAAVARGHLDLGPQDICLVSFPIAIFVRFSGDQMISETLYMDGAATDVTTLHAATMPSTAQLLELVKPGAL